MGSISSLSDRQSTDIEMETAPDKATGIHSRRESTVEGGAMLCVAGQKREFRIFLDHTTHGSHIVQVDGDLETLVQRVGPAEMLVRFEVRGDLIGGERRIRLEVGEEKTIVSPRGRTMTFRRYRHPDHLLHDLWQRLDA